MPDNSLAEYFERNPSVVKAAPRGADLRRQLRSPKRWDLISIDHRKKVDWIIRRFQTSQRSKRQIERETMLGYQHLMSYLNEKLHPWASKTYDPVFTSGVLSKQAAMADAVFSSPPIFDYAPEDDSKPEDSQALTVVSNYHLRKTAPRQRFCGSMQGRTVAGTQIDYWYWDYRERSQYYNQRVPREVILLDPVSGQPYDTFIDEGNFKVVRARKIYRDSPSFKSLHITQVFPDDSVDDIQDCEWICYREIISATEALERVVSDNWDPAAVAMAINAEMPSNVITNMETTLNWQEEIGLRVGNFRTGLIDSSDGARDLVEVIECWHRSKFMLERHVLLNQMAIAWSGPSPLASPLYPFTKTDNVHIQGQFWGLSDYRIVRWLIRGINSLRNAAISEAMLASMPPRVDSDTVTWKGDRWEPRAQWLHNGPIGYMPQFLQVGTTSRQIAHAEADKLMSRYNDALGTSEIGRGAVQAGGQLATTINQALEAAGAREKFSIENFADESLMQASNLQRDLICQNQDAAVQSALTGNSQAAPVTVFPEQFKDGSFYSLSTVASDVQRGMLQQRAMQLYQLAVQSQEPNANRRELWEMVVENIFPSAKDQLMTPEQQGGPPQGPGGQPWQQGQQPGIVGPQGGGPQVGPPGSGPPPPPGLPSPGGPQMAAQGPVAEMAGMVRGAYGG